MILTNYILMKSRNIYGLPISAASVSAAFGLSLAHVGDLKYSIDFDAPTGTPVLAALDGVVLSVKDNSSTGGVTQEYEPFGNFIELMHANGEVSEYEHLLCGTARVRVGERVAQGRVIAEVGNTGWSECPHLHFMVFGRKTRYVTRRIRFHRAACLILRPLAANAAHFTI